MTRMTTRNTTPPPPETLIGLDMADLYGPDLRLRMRWRGIAWGCGLGSVIWGVIWWVFA